MNRLTNTFASALCALAASLLVAACGGGDATAPPAPGAGGTPPVVTPDTTPPSVSIFNNAGAAMVTGPVTFSFVFSEDVGSSFDVTDVVVIGGTAGTLTKVSATQYTLVLTPAANAVGSLDVSIAAGKFSDLAGNANTGPQAATLAYNTVGVGGGGGGGGGSAALITFDEAVAVQLTDFGVNGAPPVLATDPAGGTNKVLKIFKYKLPAPGSEQWAGVTISTIHGANPATNAGSILAIPFTAMAKTMTARVFSPAVGVRVRIKVEDASNNGVSVETDAITTMANAWETLTFDFANPGLAPPVGGGATSPLDLTKTYNRLSVFMDFGIGNGGSGPLPADRTYYIDDITFVAAGGGGGGGGGGSCGTTAPTCAPTASIPSGAITIYSDASSVAGLNMAPDWGQGASITRSEVTIASNKSEKYVFTSAAFLYQGIDWTGAAGTSTIDVSAKTTLHLDLWSADIASIKISLIGAGGGENAVTKTLTAGSWNSIDIDLALYTGPDKTKTIQLKLEPISAGTLYADNIYFGGTAGGGGAVLTFSSGFAVGNRTVEGGEFGGFSGSNQDGFNCSGGPAFCGSGGAFTDTVAAAASSFFYYYQTPSPATALYMGIFELAPGVVGGLSATVNTSGIQISGQTSIKFTLSENSEYFTSGTNNFAVDLALGKLYLVGGNACHIQLRAIVTPTAAAPTVYTVPLSSFSVVQDCAVAGVTTTSALAASPISQVSFQGVGGSIALTAGGKTSGANLTVPTGSPAVYPTTLAITGGITFQ